MLTPFQVADLQQDAGGRLGDLRSLAAHDPGDARGPVAVADQDRLGVEGALDAVERGHPLAVGRGANDQRAVRDPIEVERVQRLSGEQHHVVGDVDDVVDRPLAGRDQPRLQPQRRGADRHLGEHAGGEARTKLRDLHGHRRVVRRLALAGGLRVVLPRRLGQRSAAERVHLPRHPVDAEAVDAVRGDLELEHGLRESAGPRRAEYRESCPPPPRLRLRGRRGCWWDERPTARLFRPRRRRSGARPRRGSCRRRSTPRSSARPSSSPSGHHRARQRHRPRSARRRRWGRRRRSCASRRPSPPRRRSAGRRRGAARPAATLPTTKPSVEGGPR